MTVAHINRIGTAVPPNDIHAPFIAFARTLLTEEKQVAVFDRMAERAGIAHRFSCLRPGNLEAGGVTLALTLDFEGVTMTLPLNHAVISFDHTTPTTGMSMTGKMSTSIDLMDKAPRMKIRADKTPIE